MGEMGEIGEMAEMAEMADSHWFPDRSNEMPRAKVDAAQPPTPNPQATRPMPDPHAPSLEDLKAMLHGTAVELQACTADNALDVLERSQLALVREFTRASRDAAAQQATPPVLSDAQIMQIAAEIQRRLEPETAAPAAPTDERESLLALVRLLLAAVQAYRAQTEQCMQTQKTIADKMLHLLYRVEDCYLAEGKRADRAE